MILDMAIEWSPFLRHILEIPGENLGPKIGYLDEFFVFFPSPSRQMPVYCEGVSKLVTN
jgi:hypothetical protein